MTNKSFFAKNWIHFAVLAVFLITMFAYFAPEYDGYGLKQHDVEQYKGMSNETQHFRELNDEEPLWTNSMFGGMPTIQISTLYKGNIFQRANIWFLGMIGVPAGIFLIHLIGFYIMAMCLRIKPVIAMLGSMAFALSTYEILILQAGHNSKAVAVALMAPVLGAFIMAYRRNWKWGVILSALFMTLELSANHLQVTYYLGILLFFIGLYELIHAIRTKELKQFAITSGGIIGGFLLALFINYGNISITNDYAKRTIRGENDLSITPDGSVAQNTGGLEIDYITNWSYGKGESFTLLSPYVKGSKSGHVSNMSKFKEMLETSDRTAKQQKEVMEASYLMRDGRGDIRGRGYGLYWGDQPMTGGPFYLGVLVLFLAVLGLVFIKDKIKWVLFGVAILALMLSWGKNFMGLTEFFVDNVPGYNKFRTVTIILVLVELIIPVIGVLFLQKLYDNRDSFKERKNVFIIASGAFMIFLLGVKFVGLGDNYSSQSEIQSMNEIETFATEQLYSTDASELAGYGIDINNKAQMQSVIASQVENYEVQNVAMKQFRSEVFHSSMNRSLIVAFFSIGIMALFFFTNIPSMAIIGGLGILLLADLLPVDRMYLGSEFDAKGNYIYWGEAPHIAYPITITQEDALVMESEIRENPKLEALINKGAKAGEAKAEELEFVGNDRRRVVDSYKFSALNMNTSYRVYDLAGNWNSSRASYFHKSLGGYHGAKLRNIQNLFEFQIQMQNGDVFDMLNVKYFLQSGQARVNPTALGNAWFVKDIKQFESPNDEIRALGSKIKVSNLGQGQLLINGVAAKTAEVFAGESAVYLLNGDSLNIPLPNELTENMKALFVADDKGNANLVPEQTVTLDTANSFTSLAELILVEGFTPADEAVMLKSEASKLKTKKFSGEGSIELQSYAPNKMVYKSNSKGKQLAVFSEIYYPNGWTATVDGKEQNILKVNYLLRGLELESGDHEIVFSYDLPILKTSNTYAVIGTILLALLIAFGIWKVKMKEEEVEVEA